MGAEQQNELTDVALCYQSMGVRLDSSPPEIEQRYRSIADVYKMNLESPDAALREEARKNLQLLNEIYDKIRGSITYRAILRDYQKKNSDAAVPESKTKRPLHKVVAEMSLMMHCPRCNGLIGKELKTCPICKSPIYSAMQKILRTYFTPGRVIAYCMIVLVVSLVALRILSPESFSRVKTPDVVGQTDQVK